MIKIQDVDFSQLHKKNYRLNNLYRIISKNGENIPFRMNPVQAYVEENSWYREVILKARQVGLSTYSILDFVDDAIWNENCSVGIVSYSLIHAKHILKRIIGHAIDTLPEWLDVNVKSRSAQEISFSNGSVLRVDTTLRGVSCQRVLVTEFGKTCAREPLRAEEVVTGTLETVPKDGRITIESTAEGSDGYFYDIVMGAAERGNEGLTSLDYKLFFFPWYQDKEYRMDNPMNLSVKDTDYFKAVEKELGIVLEDEQKWWYVRKSLLLADKMSQEYPTTMKEAFASSSEAYYFAEAIREAYADGRCVSSNIYDPMLPVYAVMDIGVNDLTVISFFQVCHGENRFFDYYEDKNKGLDFYANFLLKDKPYHYNTIFLPHDSRKRDPLDVENSYERDFKRLFQGTGTQFIVLPRKDKQISIAHTRTKISSMVFNIARVKPFLDHCAKYRKKWSEAVGMFIEEPLHDIHSNHADCLMYGAQAISILERRKGTSGAMEKHLALKEDIKRMI